MVIKLLSRTRAHSVGMLTTVVVALPFALQDAPGNLYCGANAPVYSPPVCEDPPKGYDECIDAAYDRFKVKFEAIMDAACKIYNKAWWDYVDAYEEANWELGQCITGCITSGGGAPCESDCWSAFDQAVQDAQDAFGTALASITQLLGGIKDAKDQLDLEWEDCCE